LSEPDVVMYEKTDILLCALQQKHACGTYRNRNVT